MKNQVIALGFAVGVALLLSACGPGVIGAPEPRRAANDPSVTAGRELIAGYGCGACHTIPGVPGADSTAAPPLDHFYQRSYIAGRLANTEENLVQWLQDPPQLEPGTAMPNLGVSREEARNIAAYLYHQPTLTDLINWR